MRDGDVLVVEDERIVALHLRQRLVKLGYKVTGVVYSGQEALRLIRELRPAVVLMDIHIDGDLDGIETASRFPAELGTLVVYVSANAEEATLERARATNPYGYLVKPFSERELHATIQMALERRALDSELRAVQGLLKRERDAAQRYLDIASVILLELDVAGNVTLINRLGCRILGYDDPREIIGRSWVDAHIPEEARDEARDAHRRLIEDGDSSVQTCFGRIVTKTGGERFIAWRNSVLLDHEGAVTGSLSSGEDTTERRATEEQLRQAQKMEAIGNLTGGMAHDFNNLLGIIIGNLGMATEQIAESGELQELVSESLDAAWRGADLTRRLLAFARRQPLRPSQINVNDLVSDTVRLLRRVLGEDVEVSLQLAEDLWHVTVDPAQLESSLANLANNARDAMPKGGRLIFSTGNRCLDTDYVALHADATGGDFAMIEVSDTGTGMPAETVSRIFEPFFTTKERGRGTGLGLSMVFGFIKQSGGHINVYSEPNIGTTVRLYLPRTVADGHAAEPAAIPMAGRGGGETVLVVEDNRNMRCIVLKQLRDLGYRTLECDTAVVALDILHSVPVDLLLTDIVMPGRLDGIDLARLAKERLPALSIVLTSGFPQSRLDQHRNLLGDLPLLSKPYSKEQLAAVLAAALAGSRGSRAERSR
jgi:PAS domain S-box-containing protein